jgi:hypothetical protein
VPIQVVFTDFSWLGQPGVRSAISFTISMAKIPGWSQHNRHSQTVRRFELCHALSWAVGLMMHSQHLKLIAVPAFE